MSRFDRFLSVRHVAFWTLAAGIASVLGLVLAFVIALREGKLTPAEPQAIPSGTPTAPSNSTPPVPSPGTQSPPPAPPTAAPTAQPSATAKADDITFSIEPRMASSEITPNVYQATGGKLTVEWVYRVLGPSGPVKPCNVRRTVTNLGTAQAVERAGPFSCDPLVQRVFLPVGRYRLQADFRLADLNISKTVPWEFEVRG
jgi:hypothetical protein